MTHPASTTKWDGSREQWDADEATFQAIPYGHLDTLYGPMFVDKSKWKAKETKAPKKVKPVPERAEQLFDETKDQLHEVP